MRQSIRPRQSRKPLAVLIALPRFDDLVGLELSPMLMFKSLGNWRHARPCTMQRNISVSGCYPTADDEMYCPLTNSEIAGQNLLFFSGTIATPDLIDLFFRQLPRWHFSQSA